MASLHTLAFEIGTEEIPAFDLHKATGQLEKLVPEALDAVRIPHGTVSVHTTPRRLIVLAEDVADETEALQEVFRGPSAKIAFDAEGNPTKAAIGFARGKGLDVEALERREENGAEYVFAARSVPARDVAELLPGVLEGVTMVFVPAVTTFVISQLMGGGKVPLIGDIIQNQFGKSSDWHFGATLSLLVMVVVLAFMGALRHIDREDEARKEVRIL